MEFSLFSDLLKSNTNRSYIHEMGGFPSNLFNFKTMILEIYATLMIISLTFIWLGYYNESVIIKVIGFLILASVNIVNINDGWEYKSGHTIEQTIINENETISVLVNDYTPYSNSTINLSRVLSLILTVLGIFGSFYFPYEDIKEGGSGW